MANMKVNFNKSYYLISFIKNYSNSSKKYIEPWKEFVKNSKNIDEAIVRAVNSRESKDFLHPHQYRINKKVFVIFKNELIKLKNDILDCNSFKCLINIGDELAKNIHGAGPLFSYDIMLRIAEYLKKNENKINILPDNVYLHAHTLKSVKAILKNVKLGRFVDKTMLPKEFQHLEPFQIEEILCIYYKDIKELYK